MKEIAVNRNKPSECAALIDDADFDLVNQYTWYLGNRGHASAWNKGRGGIVKMQRVILNPPDGMVVEHINGIRLDNQRVNLRLVPAIKHGHTSVSLPNRATKAYAAWRGMKTRCENKDFICYQNYGGRGITYCERWKSFDHFLADMGEPPNGYTLDRIDPNGNYCPDNCRWATLSEQARNKTNNVMITFNGRTLCQSDWAREMGVEPAYISYRRRRGIPVEQILSALNIRDESDGGGK